MSTENTDLTRLETMAVPWKDPVRVATTGNITLSGLQTIDTVTVVEGDRVLVKDQTNSVQNGIYDATTGPWSRSQDFDTPAQARAQSQVAVAEGSNTGNRDTTWALASNDPIVPGTTLLYWTRTSPAYIPATPRFPWSPTGVLAETIDRRLAVVAGAALTTAGAYLMGGLVLQAGRPYTGVSLIFTTAGVTYTNRWVALVDQNRVVLARSASVTTAPTVNVLTQQNFEAIYTPTRDIPVYVTFGYAATTQPALLSAATGLTHGTTLAPMINARSAVTLGTLPAVGSTLAALTVHAQPLYMALV